MVGSEGSLAVRPRLTPEHIREGRHAIGYSNQQEFADCLGVAVATVSHWETGAQVQERFRNDMIEAFFTVPEFRRFLEEKHGIKRPVKQKPVPMKSDADHSA
jgi:transcriptional regulator with XRE-family HTH domain